MSNKFANLFKIFIILLSVYTVLLENNNINNAGIKNFTESGQPQLIIKQNNVKEIVLKDSNKYEWSTPNPYTEGQDLIIKAEEGYFISVIIKKCDIEGEDGDFLLLKSGSTVEDDGTGRIFTYNLDTPRTYLIHSNTVFVNFMVFGSNSNERSGFTIEYQRYGSQVTTLPPPTTGIPWPKPSGNESIYIKVNVSGRADVDYANEKVLNDFKRAVVGMATEYCNLQNIILEELITIANIHIHELVKCPITWEHNEKCVQVRFALPIFIDENLTETWTGYQLTAGHLEQMWKRLAQKYLSIIGLSVYDEPNYDKETTIWLIVTVIVVILVLLLLLGAVTFVRRFSSTVKRRMSDAASIISSNNGRKSDASSLGPHPLQTVPQFFETDFPMYEPDQSDIRTDYLPNDDSDDENAYHIFSTGHDNNGESHS